MVSSRMRPDAVRANPSIASWAAPTTVRPASINTIAEATMTEGRASAAPGRPVPASAGASDANSVRTAAAVIWLKKNGTRARARPNCVSAARAAARNARTVTTGLPPNMIATPTASRPCAATTMIGRREKGVRRIPVRRARDSGSARPLVTSFRSACSRSSFS